MLQGEEMKKHKKTVKWCVKQIRKLADGAYTEALELHHDHQKGIATNWKASPGEVAGRSLMLNALADDILRKAGVDE
jgi:hypothetical protein